MAWRLINAHFEVGAVRTAQFPEQDAVEFALVGRSNVGKSSLLNALFSTKKLVKTSKAPGRTRELNFFAAELIDQEEQRLPVRFVDLPGYGFARTSRELQQHWQKTINRYFSTRQALRGLVLPIDIRRGLMAMDQEMLDWCHYHGLPAHLLLTKRDKLSKSEAQNTLRMVQRQLAESPLFSAQLFSATKKEGVEEAREKIVQLLMNEPRPVNS